MTGSEKAQKVAVLTGAAGGIGSAVARALVEAGYSVVLADINENGLAQVGGELAFGNVVTLAGDLADEAFIGTMISTALEQFGRLDLLVNNAGITGPVGSFQTSTDDFERVYRVNVRAPFLASVAAARVMKDQVGKGSIVNVASSASIRSTRVTPIPAYDASKGAVASLTRSLAVEWAPIGIRVNAVGPGPLDTPMSFPLPPEDESRKRAMIPMGRRGLPEEVAGAILFLASDAASYISGHVLFIDGALTA